MLTQQRRVMPLSNIARSSVGAFLRRNFCLDFCFTFSLEASSQTSDERGVGIFLPSIEETLHHEHDD